jgi:hypothetical protein
MLIIEIGISRLDFDLNYSVRPTAIFMGSIFGDNENSIEMEKAQLVRCVSKTTSTGTIQMIRKSFDNRTV